MKEIVVKPPQIPEETKREMSRWFQKNCPEFFARKCEEIRKKAEKQNESITSFQ